MRSMAVEQRETTETIPATRVIRGACPHDCPDTCATLTEVRDGQAVRFVAAPEHPVTQGWLCAKVRPYLERVYHPDRLQTPLRRIGPKGAADRWEPLTWDDAIGEIASHWQAIIARYGAAAILPYSYSGTLGLLQLGITNAQAVASPHCAIEQRNTSQPEIAAHCAQCVPEYVVRHSQDRNAKTAQQQWHRQHIGQQEPLDVDPAKCQQHPSERTGDPRVLRGVTFEHGAGGNTESRQFDDGVKPADGMVTIAATPALERVADQGHQVERCKPSTARLATGPCQQQWQMSWQPMNEDAKKTANEGSDQQWHRPREHAQGPVRCGGANYRAAIRGPVKSARTPRTHSLGRSSSAHARSWRS